MKLMNTSTDCLQTENGRKRNEWLFVNPYLVAGVVGASFCFSWFFAILTTTDFVAGVDWSLVFPGSMHLVFVAALLIGYAVVTLFSNRLQSHRLALAMFALVCGIAPALCGFPVFGPLLHYGVAALAGAGVAVLLTLWIEFVCELLKVQIRTAVATMLVLSFAWYVGTVFVDDMLMPYVVTVYAVVSGTLYLFLHRSFSLMDDLPSIPARESDSRSRITWRPSLLTVMGSAAQGFALYWLLMPNTYTFGVSVAVKVLALVVFLFLLLDSRRSRLLNESITRRLFLPVLAACILPLLFLPEDLWVWSCALAFLFSLLPYSSAVFATCEHIVRDELSVMRTFCWARLFAATGLLLGLIAGWVAFSSEVFGAVTLPVMVVIVMMFFILVSGTVSTKSYYPGEEDGSREGSVRLGPHGEIVAEPPAARDADSGVKYFHLKCDLVSQKYGLSKRQTEVLHLLAKGRNAEYIQKQLVISPHTAKAHIYNIYQKTGSHSRQDLMDLVENTVVDESALEE